MGIIKKYFWRKDLLYKVNEGITKIIRLNFKNEWKDQQNILSKKQVKVIFDVGANEGKTVLKYHHLFPESKIFAFEPYKGSLDILSRKIKDKKNISLIDKAVGDAAGEGELNISDFSFMNSLNKPNDKSWGFKDNKKQKISIITLDDYSKSNNIEKIDILKLDVQGFEKQVITGAKNLLSSQRIDLIFIEFQVIPLYENHTLYFEIASILKNYGYDLFNLYSTNEARSGQIRWSDAIFLSSKMNEILLSKYGKGAGSGW